MIVQARRILAFVLLFVVAGSATALAGALRGKTYEGSTPLWGISDEGHHRLRLYAGGAIRLIVAGNGKSVTVRFTSPYPVVYCRTQEALRVQNSRPAAVSASGAFRATVSQRFKAGPGPAGIVQTITGHFSGGTVSGTIRTSAGGCGGVTNFSAKTR